MGTISKSGVSYLLNGDINSGRGQLGYTVTDTTFTTAALWSLTGTVYGNRYLLDTAAGGNQTVTLPTIGTGNTEAQVGYEVTIKNTGAVDNIVVENDVAATVATLNPDSVVRLVAAVAPSTWEILADNTSATGDNLQDVYDRSIAQADTPQINIQSGQPVVFGNIAGDATNDLFKVTNAANTNDFLRVHANSATAAAVTVGRQVTGNVSGSTVLSDGAAAMTNTSASVVLANNAGVLQVGSVSVPGTRVMPGVASNSPNLIVTLDQANTTDVTPAVLTVVTGVNNTIYNVKLSIIGVSTNTGAVTTAGDSITSEILVKSKNAAGTMSASLPITTTQTDASMSTSTQTVGVSGGNLTLTIVGPVGADVNDAITWHVAIELQSFKWV